MRPAPCVSGSRAVRWPVALRWCWRAPPRLRHPAQAARAGSVRADARRSRRSRRRPSATPTWSAAPTGCWPGRASSGRTTSWPSRATRRCWGRSSSSTPWPSPSRSRPSKRIAAAEAEVKTAQEEYARLQKELGAVNEQVALLKRLQETTSSRSWPSSSPTEQAAGRGRRPHRRGRAGGQDRRHGERRRPTRRSAYSAAVENLARARQELQHGQLPRRPRPAPRWPRSRPTRPPPSPSRSTSRRRQAAENKARAEALARDAAAIPGVVVRREARGSLQRLVIPLPAERLFVRRGTTHRPGTRRRGWTRWPRC